MKFEEFKERLNIAKTEESVRAIYASNFKIQYDTSDNHDLYTETVLFEFKTEKNLKNLKALATVLAQSLYYIRRLKYVDTNKPIPFFICIADKNEAAITEIRNWSTYYTSDSYDWNRPASKPDLKLIDHLVKDEEINKVHVYNVLNKREFEAFTDNLKKALNPQINIDFGDKKVINESNFEAVFDHWKNVIGQYIVNGYKPSFYFLANIQRDKIILDKENGRVVFTFEDRNSKTQKIFMKDYEYFWSIYDYVEDIDTIKGIHAKLDRLTDESQRRFEGEFYTPIAFATKAIEYLTSVLGKNWHKSGKYRIWDMAAGTGNLEYNLPAEAYKYLYLSTLHSGEADHLKKVFVGATCFQYDYLNDDVDNLVNKNAPQFLTPTWKLPETLRYDLANPEITWVIFINPPFATAQDATRTASKTGVSKTRIEQLMDNDNIGHAKRELFMQFIYRIKLEFPKSTYLGLFSKLKYLNSPDNIEFRKYYFDYQYKKGFLFHSKNFHGTKGNFPVSFLIWDLGVQGKNQSIEIDILNNNTDVIGTKTVSVVEKKKLLNYWFKRPINSGKTFLPPLSNGLTVKDKNTDKRDRAREDFLASICSNGNDFQHAKYVVILSSPNASAGAFSVIPENFEKSLMLHAVKKVPKPNWLNDRDQFLIPQYEPSREFMIDCVVWSLFSNSNQTTAMRDIKYKNQVFRIKNEFFPFLIEELKTWDFADMDIKLQLNNDQDRFVAKWLLEHNDLSEEAKAVLYHGRVVFKAFYTKLNQIDFRRFKIETWDVGWFQIRQALKDQNLYSAELDHLSKAMKVLSNKIEPQIYEFGFLDKEEIFE